MLKNTIVLFLNVVFNICNNLSTFFYHMLMFILKKTPRFYMHLQLFVTGVSGVFDFVLCNYRILRIFCCFSIGSLIYLSLHYGKNSPCNALKPVMYDQGQDKIKWMPIKT